MQSIIDNLLNKDFEELYTTEHGLFDSGIEVPENIEPIRYIRKLQKKFIDSIEQKFPNFWDEVISFEFLLNRKHQVMFVIEK